MASKTVKLMFDGVEDECLVQTDRNGEIVCHTRDGRFVKFANDIDLKAAIKDHNKANSDVPEPPGAQEAADDELKEWLGSNATKTAKTAKKK